MAKEESCGSARSSVLVSGVKENTHGHGDGSWSAVSATDEMPYSVALCSQEAYKA